MKKIAIIGGGAAGLAAALTAASKAGTQVTVFELDERVGKKILATGNGRCNFTNTAITAEATSSLGYFCFDKTNASALERAAEFVTPVLAKWDAAHVRERFAELGLMTHELKGGMVFPVTNSASSVVDVLRFACADAGVHFRTNSEVMGIRRKGNDFVVMCASERLPFDRVVIATGGAAGESLLTPLGVECERARPALLPIQTETAPIRGLSGIRVQAAIMLIKPDGEDVPQYHETGEILFRDYGVSGIAAFNLSRFIRVGDELSIDFFPQMTQQEIEAELRRRFMLRPNRSLLQNCAGMMLSRVATAILRAVGVNPEATSSSLPDVVIPRFAALLKNYRLKITGLDTKSQAQVTRGGAALSELDAQTLQVKLAPGLFVVGEAIDIDGPCGGFNLHWAWASGFVAGEQAAR